MFRCQIYDKRYSSKESLSQHMIIHEESKAFKCDVCLKVFSYKSKLQTHYRIHTGEKPFECEVCERKFALKYHLVQHQATHSEVRPFKCSIFQEGRHFKTKNHLRKHMVFHYEPKFACSHCDFKAYRKYDLNVHEQNHDKKTI